METILEIKRPGGMTASQAVEQAYQSDPEMCKRFISAAKECAAYFVKQGKNCKTVQ